MLPKLPVRNSIVVHLFKTSHTYITLSRTYLGHHELESEFIIIIIIPTCLSLGSAV